MKYIDSSTRAAEETVGFWMQETIKAGITEFRCQTGYFTLEGSSVLLAALKKCAEHGTTVRLLIGSNSGITVASHVAFIAGTLGIPRDNVSIGIVSFDGALFHPKTYHFVRTDGSQTAYVGSANLTRPAISGQNIEAGIILDTQEDDSADILKIISTKVDEWFGDKFSGLQNVKSPTDVDALLSQGYLALKSSKSEDEATEAEQTSKRISRPRLTAIFELPQLSERDRDESPTSTLGVTEKRHFLRHTEASFHYPQGTHPGHILSILYYFSGNRKNTAFDDRYIRLTGSLGVGRLAGFRRQIKYKMLAAIELGLITDVRLASDDESYLPQLTEHGRQFWAEVDKIVNPNDLIIDVSNDLSSTMPRGVNFYNSLIRAVAATSPEAKRIVHSTFLNMPAVQQLLMYLYRDERRKVVPKQKIYDRYFQSEPVLAFCNAMGIEPATDESAKHRCPFLINLLDSCGVVSQSTRDVTVKQMAIFPELFAREGDSPIVAAKRFEQIRETGLQASANLAKQYVDDLRELFGRDFLTEKYYLSQMIEVPS